MPIKILIALCIIIAGAVLIYTQNSEPTAPTKTQQLTDLPWMITINADGSSTVFGQTLGKSTLDDIKNYLPREAVVRIFREHTGELSAEAWFEKVDLGGLISHVITTLEVPKSTLKTLEQKAIKREPTVTGAYEIILSDEDEAQLDNKTIRAITYTPVYLRLDEAMLRNRFGTPDEIITENENTQRFYYSTYGLEIILNNKGKEVFQYVSPLRFDQLIKAHRNDPQAQE